jgi:hypothetical protein
VVPFEPPSPRGHFGTHLILPIPRVLPRDAKETKIFPKIQKISFFPKNLEPRTNRFTAPSISTFTRRPWYHSNRRLPAVILARTSSSRSPAFSPGTLKRSRAVSRSASSIASWASRCCEAAVRPASRTWRAWGWQWQLAVAVAVGSWQWQWQLVVGSWQWQWQWVVVGGSGSVTVAVDGG